MEFSQESADSAVATALNFSELETSVLRPKRPRLTTYDFSLDIEEGPLSGKWRGFFSFDASKIEKTGIQELEIKEFKLTIGVRNFDGRGGGNVLLENGELIGLNWRESWEFYTRDGELVSRFLELWDILDFRFVCTREVRRERLETGELVDVVEDESSYGLVRYEKRDYILD
ncbi:MAG TPA: hypothetical protein V6C95_10895 [Coleofasciculaceae cyanobacterium]